MSGGVDSNVAAALLRDGGHHVIGLCMILAGDDGAPEYAEQAENAAGRMGIEFIALDAREMFETKIIGPFVKQYMEGRTPNPCVLCNREIKFDLLFEQAGRLGADAVATGHYARIERMPGGVREYALYSALDRDKDQSYFLAFLKRESLDRILFPLGRMTKAQVRAEAEARGLASARPESQEICFVPAGDYAALVAQRLPQAAAPGDIVDLDGRVLGRHRGVHMFTVGQRKGLGIAAPEPLYVVRIRPARSEVVVGTARDLAASALVTGPPNMLADTAPHAPARVKIRYRHHGAHASINPTSTRCEVRFAKPVHAVAPGQAAVFYDTEGERVLGAGWIDEAREGMKN